MIYIVLPPELSKRSIQILIQYMYSGEATVSNDILNEVLHGGELLKIRGLWRNKQQSTESSSSAQYQSTDSVCTKDGQQLYGDKSIYEHGQERAANNLSIIKESPVIVTSPTHIASVSSHKTMSTSQHHLQTIESHHHLHSKSTHNEIGLLPPPTINQSQSTLAVHSPDTHVPNIIVKKELSLNPNDENMTIGSSVPSAHYGLVSLQIAAAVKKAHHGVEKRPTKSVSHENGNSSHCTSTSNTAQYQQIPRRYSDDYLYTKDSNDIPTSSHPNHQHDETEMFRHLAKNQINHSKPIRSTVAHRIEPIVERSPCHSSMDKSISQNQIPEALRLLTIKEEPVEWPDFEHETHLDKPNIEVSVKPELVYSKDDSEEDGKSILFIFLFSNQFTFFSL